MNIKFITLTAIFSHQAACSTSMDHEGATHGGQDVTAGITSDSDDNSSTASVYIRGGSAMFVEPANAYVEEEGCSGFKQSCRRGRTRSCCVTYNDRKAL